jgi:hypothetical protein
MPPTFLATILAAAAACGAFHIVCTYVPTIGERFLPTGSEPDQARDELKEYLVLQAFMFGAIALAGVLAQDLILNADLMSAHSAPRSIVPFTR